MLDFPSTREAKEFLAGRVEQQATRQGVDLSPVERSMLLFSETDWAPPDMQQISETFDRDYDQSEYERKLAPIVRAAFQHATDQGPDTAAEWSAAVQRITGEDHYLLVLLAIAHGRLPIAESKADSRRHIVKLFTIGVLLAVVTGGLIVWICYLLRARLH